MSRDLAERLAGQRREATRIIVSGSAARIRAIAERHGGRVTKQLRGGAVIEIAGDRLEGVTRDPEVDHLSGDVPVTRLMGVTTEAIGADQVWRGPYEGRGGYTGAGIGVAVIDSGIAWHPALRRRVVAAVDFTGSRMDAWDRYGHGTHVAGTIAGAPDAGYGGVAPGAHLVALKVLGADGSGETSDVIAAIDWAIEHRVQYRLRVINLSLGHPVFESYRDDPLCQAVQRAVDAGPGGRGGGGQLRQGERRAGGGGRDRVAGQRAGGADRGREQHAGHRRSPVTM